MKFFFVRAKLSYINTHKHTKVLLHTFIILLHIRMCLHSLIIVKRFYALYRDVRRRLRVAAALASEVRRRTVRKVVCRVPVQSRRHGIVRGLLSWND